MSESAVLVETAGRAGVITINRPERLNALDLPTCQALDDAVSQVEATGGAGRAVHRRGPRLRRRRRYRRSRLAPGPRPLRGIRGAHSPPVPPDRDPGQADHRCRQRLRPRRRCGADAVHRHQAALGEGEDRRARDQSRALPRCRRHAATDPPDSTLPGQGADVHRRTHRRGGGGSARPRQPCRRARGVDGRGAGARRDDRRASRRSRSAISSAPSTPAPTCRCRRRSPTSRP